MDMFRPCYYAILSPKNGLKGNRKRRNSTQYDRVMKNIITKMGYTDESE